jgi:superfamily II DNA or RNA helicase
MSAEQHFRKTEIEFGEIVFVDDGSTADETSDPPAPQPPPPLRDYQRTAVECISEYLDTGAEEPFFISLPTGTGKSVVIASLAPQLIRRGRILVIAHMQELVGQLADHFARWCGPRRVGVVMGAEDDPAADVVVGSVQTLSRPGRLDRVRAASEKPFLLIFIDECHHATAHNSYGSLVAQFPGVPILGCSATPRAGGLFKMCVFERPVAQMIAEKWLAPLRQQRVVLPVDFSSLPSVLNSKTGERDYTQPALALSACDPEVVRALAEGSIRQIGKRTALAFCVNIAHAQLLAEAYCEAGFQRFRSGARCPKNTDAIP